LKNIQIVSNDIEKLSQIQGSEHANLHKINADITTLNSALFLFHEKFDSTYNRIVFEDKQKINEIKVEEENFWGEDNDINIFDCDIGKNSACPFHSFKEGHSA